MMRGYIHSFRQDVLIDMDISANELLVLDQFMVYASPTSDMKKKHKDNKAYFWITYGKIMQDLPILNITDRTYRNYIRKFSQLGIIDKYSENSTELYIHINLDVLIKEQSSYTFTFVDSPTRFCQDGKNESVVTVSNGSYMLYNKDLTDDVKKAIVRLGLKQFRLSFMDHIKLQLGNDNPALNGAFDSVEINTAINNVIEIKAIHAHVDTLKNLSRKIFKSLSFAVLYAIHSYPQSYPQADEYDVSTN